MSSDTDDDGQQTRPISVAELLARNGTIGSPPVGGRRRRRKGNSAAVTVAELTAEIPVIRDDMEPPGAVSGEAVADEPDSVDPESVEPESVDSESTGETGETGETGDPEADTGSEPDDAAAQEAESEVPAPEPEAPEAETVHDETPPQDEAPEVQASDDREPDDQESDDQESDDQESDDQESDDQAPEGDSAATGSDAPAAAPRQSAESAPPRASDPRPQRSARPERSYDPRPNRRPSGAEQMAFDPVDETVDIAELVGDQAAEEQRLRSYLTSSGGALFSGGTVADDLARRGVSGEAASDDAATARGMGRTAGGDGAGGWRGTVRHTVAAVLQSVLAVVFGAGMFVAFDQLWRWNTIVALVLSVLVILGLVVAVRVVRRTEDIASTLIAVAVGALVTLGPLALLQSYG